MSPSRASACTRYAVDRRHRTIDTAHSISVVASAQRALRRPMLWRERVCGLPEQRRARRVFAGDGVVQRLPLDCDLRTRKL